MPPSVLTRLRRSGDARSAGRALAVLFLLAGFIGAFASGAAALPGDAGLVTCLSALSPDGGEGGGAPLACCPFGCPMVTAAVPNPSSGGLVLPISPDQPVAPGSPNFVTARSVLLIVGDGPRGPPIVL
jgi:hypothetical protein